MGKSTKDSKKRSRTAEEDVNSIAVVKKSKLDESGNAEVTKVETEAPKVKKDKKEKKEKKSKTETTEEEPKEEKKEKKDKKKDKKEKKDKTAATEEESKTEEKTEQESTDKKSKKKDKKKNKDKTEEKKTEDGGEEATTNEEEEQPQANGAKGARFIIFVGNMPYSITADDIKEHFASVHPISVRLLTHRDNPTKSKGTAFVEFGRFDHMKTALEKFHHSEMLDDKGVPRKINVELSAGGGGKTAHRQDKIKEKNRKLNEERLNRQQNQEKAKQEKAAAKANGGNGDAAAADGAAAAPAPERNDEDAIHPSRRARVAYDGNPGGGDFEEEDSYGGGGGGGSFGGRGRGRGGGGGGSFGGRGRGGRGRGGGRGSYKKW